MRTGEQPEIESRPRIVMLLANEFVHDTRVFKQARSLIEWGCEVHVVAMAKPHLPRHEIHHDIHVHRVPMTDSGLRHVLAALGVWWSRRLLRRVLAAPADDEPMHAPPTVLEHTQSIERAADAVDRPAPLSLNGATTGSATDAEASRAPHGAQDSPTTPVEPDATAATNGAAGFWTTSRSLPARAFRRAKVVASRSVRRARRSTWLQRAVSRPARFAIRVVRRVPIIARRILKRSIARVRRFQSRWRTRIRRWYPSPMRLLALNHRMAIEARTLKPDVIEAHDLNTLLGAMMVRRADATPVVYDSHELYLERNIGDRSRLMDKLFWWPVERFGIGRCAAVLTVAEGICRHLEQAYRIRRPRLVRNVQPYEPPAPPSRLLSDELGIDPSRAIVLYPGAITINRGLEELIDSSVHLRDAAYVIMGYARNPAYLAALKQRAEALGQLGRTVYFRDAVPIEDVVRYTASSDLGIVPTQNVCLSYQFESSNKIFHCLMAGVPLVMSNHAEKRYIAETYDVALLFDETDPKAIAETVNGALSDRDRYERMRRHCLDAAKELNWEHEEHTLRTVFAGILGERARPVPAPRLPEHDPPGIEVNLKPTKATPRAKTNEYST